MKQIPIFSLIALLSISILSYGVSGAAFATSDPNPALPISTDIDIASNGASITISGNIPDYDSSSGKGLTYLILSPEEDIVGMGQLTPNSDGSFEKSFVAGGPLWKLNGDYIFKFQYGADKSEVSVNYVGGEAVITKPVEPTEPICGSGTTLVNGICQTIPKPTIETEKFCFLFWCW